MEEDITDDCLNSIGGNSVFVLQQDSAVMVLKGGNSDWKLLVRATRIGSTPTQDNELCNMLDETMVTKRIPAGIRFKIISMTRTVNRLWLSKSAHLNTCAMLIELDIPDKLRCELDNEMFAIDPKFHFDGKYIKATTSTELNTSK